MSLEVTLHKGTKIHGFYALGADAVDCERDRLKITFVSADGSEEAIVFAPEFENNVLKLRLDRDRTGAGAMGNVDKMVGEYSGHANPAELPCYLIVDTDNYNALEPDAEVPDYRILVPPGVIVTNGGSEDEFWLEDGWYDDVRVESITID